MLNFDNYGFQLSIIKKITVLLSVFILSANIYSQSEIKVEAGLNAISIACSSAASGDAIILSTDGGVYTEDVSLAISDKALTIRSATGLVNPPVWKCINSTSSNPIISLSKIISLTLEGIIFDSSSINSSPRFLNILDVTQSVIRIKNCIVKNMTYGIYGSGGASVDSLVISNSIFSDMSNRCLYFPAGSIDPGIVKCLNISNSTFKNMKATEPCIYFYSKSSPSYSPSIRIDHVTFYNTQRIRTIASVTDVQIKNTVFATDGTISSGQSFNLFGGTVQNSLIFKAPVSGNGAVYTNFLDNIDPLFVNAAAGDLTLSENSPAINTGTNCSSMGDPRWWPKSKNTISLEAGTNKISAALVAAKDGDIIELVTDGGLYKESATVIINKNITLKASSTVSNKPVISTDNGDYSLTTKANLTLQGVLFDGSKGTVNGIGAIVTDAVGYSIKIDNSDFSNFVNPDSSICHAIYGDRYSSQVDSLIINGCIFSNIKDQGIYLGGHNMTSIGAVKYLLLKNSTFSKIKNDAVYVRDNDGADATPGPILIIDHCTFYDFAGSYGILSHHIDGTVIKNCIASVPENTGKNSFYVYGTNSLVANCLYYNLSINLHTAQSKNVVSANPLFVNAANGNFMLYKNSPAVKAGDDGSTIGDPRWGVSTEVSNSLALIKKPYSSTPTSNSVRIVWETPVNASKTSVVEFGTTKQLGTKITGADGWLIQDEGYMHEVTVSGLQPFTEYYYRVSDGVNMDIDINVMKTAPLPGTNFRIVSLSDIHDNSGNIWQSMSSRVAENKPDLTVFIGDYISEGIDRTAWNAGFFMPGKPLLSKNTILPTIGNHETYGGYPITFYDYMSLPVHPANGEDTAKDKTGEAYFSTDYSDVKIIAMNANDDEYSPSFYAGSPQYIWLEDQIKSSTSKWIFIFAHVNVLSTAYHGQWSASQKDNLLPLYEKYAAAGKHIICFAGDDHSFEHLYKAGVNYVRPGCANTSLYGQFNMADMPYSVFYKETQGFSTIDVSDNGNVVTLNARDTTGVVFYSAVFDARISTLLPSFYFIGLPSVGDTASFKYKIQWTDWVDASDSANTKAALYYTADSSSTGSLIVDNIKLSDPKNSYDWSLLNVNPGSYYLYAVITDGKNAPRKKYSSGKVIVIPDIVSPPPAVNLGGSAINGKLKLTWTNPTRVVKTEKILGTFETGTDGFTGYNGGGTSTGSVVVVDAGYLGKALKINYNITVAWEEYSAIKSISGAPDYSSTPNLDFWYKGDGSSYALRLIAEQDNDRNGKGDDWWYIEAIDLSSTEWKHASIDLTKLKPLNWHTNIKSEFDLGNMFSLDFIVPASTAGSGYALIDEVKISGEVLPAPDFNGAVVIRRTDKFPANPNDGVVVYRGNSETCIDSIADFSKTNYYAVFAFDFVPNFSGLDSTSVLKLPGGIIPVELTSFTADFSNGCVNLNWKTATEKNNRAFDIERKFENKGWEKIGTINGKGTSSEPSNYKFSDGLKNLSFKGLIAYRLRQVDFDGAFSYSKELSLNLNLTPKEFSLSQNYPNPFNPSTVIEFALPNDCRVKVKVYDVLGRQVSVLMDEVKTAGYYKVNFDARNYVSGVYFYSIEAGSFKQVRKMVFSK